jgi:hypothetical protein
LIGVYNLEGCVRQGFLARLKNVNWNESVTISAGVRRIRYKDQTLELPPVEQRKVGVAVREKLLAVMTGREPDTHGGVESI